MAGSGILQCLPTLLALWHKFMKAITQDIPLYLLSNRQMGQFRVRTNPRLHAPVYGR